jgi:hypothetical protein
MKILDKICPQPYCHIHNLFSLHQRTVRDTPKYFHTIEEIISVSIVLSAEKPKLRRKPPCAQYKRIS